MAVSEKLIEMIKEHPILYNPAHADYLSTRKKENVWAEIALELNENVDRVKKKWKNLKDSYLKYLKTMSNSDSKQGNKKNYRNWPWAKQMETFRPFFPHRNVNSKLQEAECDVTEIIDSDDQSDTESSAYHEIKTHSNESLVLTDKKRKYEDDSIDDNSSTLDYIQNAEKKNRSDAIDLIFKGYAQTVTTFSPTRQAYTKLKIAQIIAEQEVQHHQEQLLHTITFPSSSQNSFRRNSPSSTGNGPISDPLEVKKLGVNNNHGHIS